MVGTSNLLFTFILDLEIDAGTGECITSHEQGPITGTGSQRPPSRAKTIPAVSDDDHPSEESGQSQRHNSLSSEGVDRSSKDEDEEPQRRVKDLKSEVETLKLQVEEGQRGREHLFLEMEMLRNDAL